MERLIRSQYWTLVWIAVICLGVMILVLPRLPDQSCTLPLALIVLGEWLFAFLVLFVLQFKTLRQSFSNLRIGIACQALAIMFFIGAIAIIFSPVAQLNQNWMVSISTGQLIIMSLGIVLLNVSIERIYNAGHDEEVNNALALQRVTSTKMKRTNSPKASNRFKFGFFSRKSLSTDVSTSDLPTVQPAQESGFIADTGFIKDQTTPSEMDRTVDEKSFPHQSTPNLVKEDARKSVQDLPAEIRRLPSVHSHKPTHKVVDPNKPKSTTMTKLQALSASGIGSVHHPAAPINIGNVPSSDQSAEPSISPVLNRLDTPAAQSTATSFPETTSPHESNLSIEPTEPVSDFAAPMNEPLVTAEETSLFGQTIDKDMDEIFAKIAPIQAQQEISHIGNTTAEQKLFQGGVDNQIEKLFSEITPPEAQREVIDFIPPPTNSSGEFAPVNLSSLTESTKSAQQNAIAQELKDFGRLSNKTDETAPVPLGTMKTIGKLLIDSQDVDNIIRKAETGNIIVNLPSARVISAVRGEGIQALLDGIDNYNGVAGSMLVGADGLVIASTYTTGGDRDSLGVLAHGLLGNSNLAMLRLDLGKLDQMIFISELTEGNSHRQVTTILTDVEVGSLAVFIDSELAIALEQLLEQLSTIARG